MRSCLALAVAMNVAWASSAVGQSLPEPRFVERTPAPRTPLQHSSDRAGTASPSLWSRFARPSVDRNDAGGYVGGTRLFGAHHSVTSSVGPVTTGTYGTDYVGPLGRIGRVFLRESPDPSRGADAARNYRTYGPQVLDVFSLRPVRKAKLESDYDIVRK